MLQRSALSVSVCIGLGISALAAVAWWLSPSSAPYRYHHTDLVTLWRQVEASPNDGLAWREIGLRLAAHGDPLAERPLREAHALRPEDNEVATALGELLLSNRSIPEAFEILRQTTERSPNFIPAWLAMGRLYQRKGSYQHAATEYERAVRLNPNDGVTWRELAVCYLQMQQSAKAQAAIAQALRVQPRDPGFLALKGTIDVGTGRVDDGLRELNMASESAPRDSHTQEALLSALLTYHRGPDDLRRASEVLASLEPLSPGSPRLLFQRGELDRLAGNYAKAVSELERARDAAPDADETYYSLSRVYQQMGRLGDAEKMDRIYRRRKDLALRIEETRIKIAARPDDPSLHKHLADLDLQVGNIHAAIDALESARQLDRRDPAIQARLSALNNLAAAGKQAQ